MDDENESLTPAGLMVQLQKMLNETPEHALLAMLTAFMSGVLIEAGALGGTITDQETEALLTGAKNFLDEYREFVNEELVIPS